MPRGGLQSSSYLVSITKENTPISFNSKIITNDIVITKEFLNGDSGLLKLSFSFNTGSDYVITVTKKGAADLVGFPLKLNADLDFTLKNNGYYKFEIAVEAGDLINLSSNAAITAINDLLVQKIQIGV